MTDEQLRALVRESVSRHLGLQPGAGLQAEAAAPASVSVNLTLHPSHYRYESLHRGENADGDAGPCLIEPAVRCNHCGYCQSHGH